MKFLIIIPLAFSFLNILPIIKLYKLHHNYFKVRGNCLTYCGRSKGRGQSCYAGEFEYEIDGKRYCNIERNYNNIPPLKKKNVPIYVNKNDYNNISSYMEVIHWIFILTLCMFFTISLFIIFFLN